MSWRLSALDFSVLWERAGFDQLPYPFGFSSQAETLEESLLERSRAARAFDERGDDGLEAVVDTLAHARVRVEVLGTQWQPRQMPIRVLGGIRGAGGVVAVQFPGHIDSAGSDVVIGRCAGSQVVGRVVDLLPPVAEGRTRGLSVELERVEAGPRRSVLQRADEVAPRQQLRQMAELPRSGQGEITVATGFGIDEVSEARSWVDIAGDGRYLIRRTSVLAVRPASPRAVVAAVDEVVGRALERLRVS
ncbi:ESX secretion-associated protein EspG [Rhodococcus sp. D2-41]|uniref:ESX secretion-associated protein EspG n=1 Tax=Speluncibacter jeojiensis TaxID=2710754 RepID=A0A9X4M0Q0_9ACTN|nr:ESX secretion-associated protein EspG [Rhodococcus sp. D2-41]MDG3011296.1 ESX secretion-associated protein EspG [Rhodococcus sp. D2-41]MDG3015853.1 ESX secretion-associated protein EspG [Corynebacteriales bacterium D3-21]